VYKLKKDKTYGVRSAAKTKQINTSTFSYAQICFFPISFNGPS